MRAGAMHGMALGPASGSFVIQHVLDPSQAVSPFLSLLTARCGARIRNFPFIVGLRPGDEDVCGITHTTMAQTREGKTTARNTAYA